MKPSDEGRRREKKSGRHHRAIELMDRAEIHTVIKNERKSLPLTSSSALTCEMRSVLARCAAVLLPVVVAIASRWAIRTSAATCTLSPRSTDASWAGWTNGLFVRGWYDFGGEVQPRYTQKMRIVKGENSVGGTRRTTRGGNRRLQE
jgi:hypothetical protein